jgi:hypothetical protein
VRSAAIRTALDRYNVAARALSPPRPSLSWEEVVEYAFLADFDLLRDARQDISQRPWATPTGRLSMDTYFKMRRAREEIQRLNIEIKRLATYLHDEGRYLMECEKQLQPLHPALAHQVALHHKVRGRFTAHHYRRLQEISMLDGFTGSITPGESVEQGAGASASSPTVCIPMQLVPGGSITPGESVEQGAGASASSPTVSIPMQLVPGGLCAPQGDEEDAPEDLEEKENAEVDGEEHARILEGIMQVALDG